MQTPTDRPVTLQSDELGRRTTYDAAQEFLKGFPRRQLISARWMPVFIEPITHSGERITVAVAVVADGESPSVVNTLNAEALSGVFGRYGDHLMALADSITAELQAWLATGGALDGWRPMLSGVYQGRITKTRNVDIKAIIRSACMNTSLFSAKRNERVSDGEGSAHLNRFQAEIKRIVTSSRVGLKDRFNRPMELYGKRGKHYISYVGTNLAINLSTLDPSSNATYQVATAQRKITNLLRLRDIVIGHSHDELLMGVFVPSRSLSPAQEDSLDAYTTELEYAARKAEVGFEVVHGADGLSESAMPFARKILADA